MHTVRFDSTTLSTTAISTSLHRLSNNPAAQYTVAPSRQVVAQQHFFNILGSWGVHRVRHGAATYPVSAFYFSAGLTSLLSMLTSLDKSSRSVDIFTALLSMLTEIDLEPCFVDLWTSFLSRPTNSGKGKRPAAPGLGRGRIKNAYKVRIKLPCLLPKQFPGGCTHIVGVRIVQLGLRSGTDLNRPFPDPAGISQLYLSL